MNETKENEEDAPCYAPMQRPALQHTAKVMLRAGLFVRMDVSEKGFANEGISLVGQVTCEYGVDVEEAEVWGEEGPVWGRGGR